MSGARAPRRCASCGDVQRITYRTIDYRESGLENLELGNAPVWECGNGHEEVEIPRAEQLHTLLTNMLIRKQTVLTGSELRFLRKELAMSGKAFARQLGMTAEHLSRLETGRREITRTTDLLVRLAVAWELTRRERIEFPLDLQPFVKRLEAMPEAGKQRVEHRDDAPPNKEWVSVSG